MASAQATDPSPTAPPATTPSSARNGGPGSASSRVHSCVLCQQRKVKCDRKFPCAGCTKAGVDCVSSTPAPPRRRKRKLPEAELHARLKHYEELLKTYGAPVDGSDYGNGEAGDEMDVDRPRDVRHFNQPNSSKMRYASPSQERGKLIADRSASKFLDNNLWTGLTDEFHDPREMSKRHPDEERYDSPLSNDIHTESGSFLFGLGVPLASLAAIHPQPVQIFRLWQTFLDNVNPLSKLLHSPSVQHQVLEATGNLGGISRPIEALMFAIYSAAVNSMDNADCENMLGESKSTMLRKFLVATQQALIRACFLKTLDIVVLQAFTIFLLSIRQTYDPHALWILTGIAVRIGQRMGIHRDGASLGLTFFEAEMRRRLCWQIVLLDSRSAQVSGSGASVMDTLFDTKLPLNVNDSDLNPEMKESPMEHNGLTEMVFCLMRYEFGSFLREQSSASTYDADWQNLSSASVSLAEKDRKLEELESRIESKFLRYCDPLIPLHTLTSAVARAAFCKMRLVAHHPRQYLDNGASLTQKEKDMLFSTSVRMIEYDTMGLNMKSMRRYLWHINCFYQLDGFVYMINELRHRRSGDLADRAWQQVQDAYDNHPELITDVVNPLYVAVGNLTVRAWASREAELARLSDQAAESPRFISLLRRQRQASQSQAGHSSAPPGGVTNDRGPSFGGGGRIADEDPAGGPYLGSERPDGSPTHLHSTPGEASAEATPYSGPSVSGTYSSPYQRPLLHEHEMDPGSLSFDAALPPELSPMDWDYWNDLLQANELHILEGNGQKLFV